MRSLWVLALTLHVIVFIRTRCCWAVSQKGIPGIPEFSISTIAMLTMSTQYRKISFCDTSLMSVEEVAASARVRVIRSIRHRISLDLLQLFFFSDLMDVKCLIASSITVVAGLLLVWALIRALGSPRLLRRCEFYMWPCTFASFATDALWPVSVMMVSWNGFALVPIPARTCVTIQPIDTSSHADNSMSTLSRTKSITSLNKRGIEELSSIRLMNIAAMTDPIVYFRLRWLGGRAVDAYKLKRNPRKVFFLPSSVSNSSQDMQLNWPELAFVRTVNSMELDWSDLVQCG